MDISVIIVNYRAWRALDECLASLQAIDSKVLTFEVIVVDNFSNDGLHIVFQKKYHDFKFIANSGNNGFSNGCNFGASKATGKYLLFLNPDTTITQSTLEKLLEISISNQSIGILSCLQFNENNIFYKQNNLFPALGRFFGISRIFYRKFYKKTLSERFDNQLDLFYPDWVTGALIFISKNWFEKINGWNEDYWLYYEDVDICKKIIKIGGQIAVTKKTAIFHKHGGASRINIKTKALTKTEVIISRHVYVKNHFSKSQQIIIQSMLIVNVLTGKLVLSLLSLFLFFIPKLKVNQLIIKNLIVYYLNAIKTKKWTSPRSMNNRQKGHF